MIHSATVASPVRYSASTPTTSKAESVAQPSSEPVEAFTSAEERPSFLDSKSIAVIGGSNNPGVGNTILTNLLKEFDGHHGEVNVVNIKGGNICGKEAYTSVMDLPDNTDLAVIAIPAKYVPDTLRQCGEKGIQNAVVISAGFDEADDGAALQADLKAALEESDSLTIMGPNCLGFINTKFGLDASFAVGHTPPGSVSIISQSGGVLINLREAVKQQGAGIATMYSLGNKMQFDEPKALDEIRRQGDSRVVVMYTEGVNDGRELIKAIQETTETTPVVVLKGGRSAAGAKAAASHTGSLAGAAGVFDAAMDKAGAIVVRTQREAADVASFFSKQPVPEGNRLGIVTNGGGPGILATDVAEEAGLKLAALEPERIRALDQRLAELGAPHAGLNNPIDVVGDAGADRYEAALRATLEDPNVDCAQVLLVAAGPTELEETAKVIGSLAREFGKPVVASFMGGGHCEEAIEVLREEGIPAYDEPADGVRVLGHAARYGELQRTNHEPPMPSMLPAPDKGKARGLVEKALATGRKNLGAEDVFELMRAYGLPVVDSGLATTKSEAVAHAERVGYPVALKVASDDIIHKKDLDGKAENGARGVYLNINSAEEMEERFDQISEAVKTHCPEASLDGLHVVKMASNKDAWEIIVGASTDPTFGTTLMYGEGGTYVEAIGDVDFEVAPTNASQVRRELTGLNIYKRLQGVRGDERSNIELLSDVAARFSEMAYDLRDVLESVEVNPFFVYQGGQGLEGVLAVDGRAALKQPEGAAPPAHH